MGVVDMWGGFRAEVYAKRRALAGATGLLVLLASIVITGAAGPSAAQQSQAAIEDSCLAQNGRIDVILVNSAAVANSYVVGVSGLAPREREIEPGETLKISFTGRADGVYQVTADRVDGARLAAEAVSVSCDPADPIVDVSVSCISNNGVVAITARNNSDAPATYAFFITGLPARQRTIAAQDSATVSFSGRPDKRYRVDVSAGDMLVFRNPYQISCDPPVLDGVTTIVDCVAGNGRIQVSVANETQATDTYFVTVEGLAPRSIILRPDSVGTVSVTGRADRSYVVTVAAGTVDEVFATRIVTVACDTAAPTPTATAIPIPTVAPTPVPTLPPAPTPTLAPPPPRPAVQDRAAAVGDYGGGFNSNEIDVANLIDAYAPDFIATLGDNVYSGEDEDPWAVLDRKVGQYYHEWIFPYLGSYGEGSPTGENRFFPSLGNHDFGDPGTQLLYCEQQPCTGAWVDFFTLPNNERYYVTSGESVDFFIINDYYLEPDGHTADSVQAEWLRTELANSDAPWKIIVNHFPPYANGSGGSPSVRWPFKEWGADAMLSGHVHSYERIQREGFTYITNGLGGINLRPVLRPTPWTRTQFNAQFGFTMIEASPTQLTMELITTDREVADWTVEYQPGAGETVESIAQKFAVSASLIRDLNPDVNLDGSLVGTKVTVAPR